MFRSSRRFTLIELLFLVGTIGLIVALLSPALMKARERSCAATCANNLRQLGIAATSYSDDKRFYPHYQKPARLDGDWTTEAQTATIRMLLWYGYTDTPEGWTCPESGDWFVPINDRSTRRDTRRWFWDGKHGMGSATLPPIADPNEDRPLRETSELSYGWTRKGMNTSVRSTALLSADRSVRRPGQQTAAYAGERGNHATGWNVLQADAAVIWLAVESDPPPSRYLTGITLGPPPHMGYLAMHDQSNEPW